MIMIKKDLSHQFVSFRVFYIKVYLKCQNTLHTKRNVLDASFSAKCVLLEQLNDLLSKRCLVKRVVSKCS